MEAKHTLTTGTRLLTQVSAIILLLAAIFMQEANAQNAVGSVNGALTVNDMGAAVYSVTFDAPNGGRMTPKVGLAYNSQSSGYGLAGYGIDVTGISVITSGGRDIFHNGKVRGVNYDKDSNFYLDGKRLVLQEGEDGMEGAVYSPEGDPYTKATLHYGVENSGASYFSVSTNDGTTYTYGQAGNSKLRTSVRGYDRVAAWYICEAINKYGESIQYKYTGSLHLVPSEITYGTSRGISAKIEFTYKTMASGNERPFHIGNWEGTNSTLLSSVTTSINGQTHRRYDFTYDETASDKFSRLVRIIESNGAGESLNPTELTWGNKKEKATISYDVSYTKQFPYEYTSGNVCSVDINGDGINDIVRIGPGCDNAGVREKTIVRILLSKIANDGSVSFSQMDGLYTLDSNSCNFFLQKVSAMDFDGDGLNDIVLMLHFTGWIPGKFVPRTKIVILYGKNILGNNNHYAVDLQTNVSLSPNAPVATTLDMDGDGREDLFVLDSEGVEREVRPSLFDPTGTSYKYTAYDAIGINYDESYGPNASSEPHFVLANVLGRIAARPHFSFRLCDKVKKLFTADCNNDGLSDLIIIHNNCYTIYFNNGYRKLPDTDTPSSRYIAEQYRRLTDVFTDENRFVGSQLKDFWRMEQGDFDGDGLLDFFYHDKNTASYGIAYNNGDGTFRIQTLPNNWGCYEHIDSNEDDDKFAIRVLDFDRDGKSDVVISKYEFGDTKIKWLRSTGYGFEPWYEHAYNDKDNSCEGLILTGDFDGDGIVELANVGRLLNADYSENTDNAIHIYNIGNKDASLGRITSILDGYGNVINISYEYATSPKIYTNGESAYPVNSYTLPIALVANVTSDNMNISYQYEDMKMHIDGRGVLGFAAVETYDAIHESSTRREITEWDDSKWIAKKIKTTNNITGIGSEYGNTSTSTSSYTIENVGNNWYSYLSNQADTDFDGNATYRRIRRDKTNGQIVYDCLDKDDENCRQYSVNSYAFEYENIAGMWLPPHQYIVKKSADDTRYAYVSKDYEYDSEGNVTSVTSGGSSMYLDSRYIDGLYHRTDYTYDRWGNVTSETFHGNDESTGYKYYEYDPTGRFLVKTYTVPESTTTSYTYDVFGNMLTETDETNASNPLTTIHTYDTWGRRINTVNPDGTETIYYTDWDNDDNIGNWFSEERHTGAPWTRVTYDRHGREIATSTVGPNYINVEKNTEYNEKGQVSKITNIYGKRTTTETFTYDARGRVLTDMHSSGASTTYEYGRNTVSVTDAAGRTTTKSCDPWGNVKTVTDNEGNIVEYQYGSHGKPVNVTTGDATVTMEYDELGRRTKLVDPDAGTVTTTYGKNGQVSSETDGRGVKTTYTYDALGRVTQRKRENTTNVRETPSITSYTYGTSGNSKGRIVKKDCAGKAVSYEYDMYGRVISETRPNIYNHDGTVDVMRKTYTYNNYGQLATVTYPTSHMASGITIGYNYDSNGYQSKQLFIGDGLYNCLSWNKSYDGQESLVCSDYTGSVEKLHDKDGYLVKMSYTDSNGKIRDGFSYVWDKTTGNLTVKNINGLPFRYVYDDMDRLRYVLLRGNQVIQVMNYDNNGNIVNKSDVGKYVYDPSTMPHAVREVENTVGRISNHDVYTKYELNGKIGLIQTNASNYWQCFDYGPDDEKWSSVLIDPDDDEIKEYDIERYYWGNYERLTKDNHIREYYFLDNDVFLFRDNPMEDDRDLFYVECYQMVRDNIGNVISIYDEYGTKVFEASYDAWGKQTVIKDEICFNHGFTGHEMLPQFGLIHMDGRVYDPAIGRFLSPDNYVQLPENSQSFNRYSYCINNPLKYTDPTGENFLAALAINVGVSVFCAAAEGENVLRAAAFGALGSGLSYGIGAAFGHAAGGFGNELLRAGAHGVSGGVQSALQGGSFFSGLASGSLASMAGSGAQWAGWSADGIVNATTAAGAVGSLAFGGDWFDGAMLGYSIGTLNHTGDDDSQERGYYLEPAPAMSIEPMPWQVPSGLMDGLGLAGTASTTYAAPKYISNWFQPKYWTNSRGEWRSSKLLEKRANGKYVRGYQGYKLSHDMAAKATRIPRAIGTRLGYLSIFANGLSMFGNPSVGNAISLVRSIGSAANLGFALMDAYATIELLNYNMFIKPRIENNIRQGLPWDFGTGLDRPLSGSMP